MIHPINLAAIDLNLLVVFDAIMTERHVTRASMRLGLSQPATSNALARLRSLVEDELFIRTSGGLQPTPKAISLAQQIQPALQQIQAALVVNNSFDPALSDMTFFIGMSDYLEFTFLPYLMEKLQTIAPKMKIQVRSGERQKLLSLLDSGELDLACGVFPEQITWHEETLLFQENYVCVCSQNHPNIGDSLSLEEYLSARHLLVSIKEDMVGKVDEVLAQKNLRRDIAISVPHFLAAPFILASSQLIATLAQRVAYTYSDVLNLKIMPLPLELESFSVVMRWHKSHNKNPTHVWLRTLFTEVSQFFDTHKKD